jgi:hypothetical protein
MRVPVATVLLCAALAAPAQVYRSVGPDGAVTYSDQAQPGATPVDIAPTPTIAPPPAAGPRLTAQKTAPEGPPYTRFGIASPGNDEAVRANDGNVTVTLAAEPGLARGHSVVLRLDGSPVGAPGPFLVFELSNLDRGSHRLDAAVLGGSGSTIVEAEPVTFHVLRAALGEPSKPPPKPAPK